MTVPHLMNCPHNPDGWCLDCVVELRDALAYAEAALADIGDAERWPGDDLAWCEQRAAAALPRVRAALVP